MVTVFLNIQGYEVPENVLEIPWHRNSKPTALYIDYSQSRKQMSKLQGSPKWCKGTKLCIQNTVMYQPTIRVDTNTENMLRDVRSYDSSDFEQHRTRCVTTCNLINKYKSSVVTSRKTLNSAVFQIPEAQLTKIKVFLSVTNKMQRYITLRSQLILASGSSKQV